jgi:tetratricopeptide (TPR) repeat protein
LSGALVAAGFPPRSTSAPAVFSMLRWVNVLFVVLAVGGDSRAASAAPAAPSPGATTTDGSALVIRELEARVRANPEDYVACNKLAGYYLQRVRETGDLTYLTLADRSARASLAILPEDQNHGGLAAMAQVAYAAHDFVAARAHAERLVEREPQRASSHQILGDALLELGDYERAAGSFAEMERLGGSTVYSETRLARLAALHGRSDEARRRYAKALARAQAETPPSRETVAWCHLQLGETAFIAGDYDGAGRHYRDALAAFPEGGFRARGGLGRVQAARGDLPGAIEHYERAVAAVPEPASVGALGDLYHLVGRDREAAVQYELCERIGQLAVAGGAPYNRQLALFRADHDLRTEDAYRDAAAEYQVRRDVHGADALAWAALKAGRLSEARAAIGDALRLGTRDARLWYHAGMIARALGDRALAREHLERALELSPQFDVYQAPIARRTLVDLGAPAPTARPTGSGH